jgi:NADH-quinone oxidoreductase subunit J
MFEDIVFHILVLFLLIGASMILLGERAATYAAGFFFSMLSLSGIYALLQLSFLFLAQIMVVVAAVAILVLIAIVTVNLDSDSSPKERKIIPKSLLALLLSTPLGLLIYKSAGSVLGEFTKLPDSFGSIENMGRTLFGEWVVPFELLSILLLTSMLGAVVIAAKERS